MLVPRLNYEYTLKDAFISLVSLLKKPPNHKYLENLLHSDNIFFVNHARTGLRLVLNSIGLKKGSRIGVQAYNCYTVFNSIKAAGMQPVFLDINSKFTLDINDLKMKSQTFDCLIVTHTFGIPSDIKKIRDIFPNTPIIEDCAHSFLTEYEGKLTGIYGDAAIFSFGQGKFPSIGPVGVVIINNKKYIPTFRCQYDMLKRKNIIEELFSIIKHFVIYLLHRRPIYGMVTYPFLKNLKNQRSSWKYKQNETKCYKSSEYLFEYKSKYYNKFLKMQRRNASIILGYLNKTYLNNLNYFMIPLITKNYKYIEQYFWSNGIEVGRHFDKCLEWSMANGYVKGSCPNTENLMNKYATFSCYHSYPKHIINKYRNFNQCVF